jgi:hypothetical protein
MWPLSPPADNPLNVFLRSDERASSSDVRHGRTRVSLPVQAADQLWNSFELAGEASWTKVYSERVGWPPVFSRAVTDTDTTNFSIEISKTTLRQRISV